MHILKQVPSTCTLRRILKQAIFGKRVHCPHCGSRYIRTLKQEERWRCTQCQLPFSIKSSCWLKGSKLPLETIWLLLWCWQKKFTLQHAQEVVGVSGIRYIKPYFFHKIFFNISSPGATVPAKRIVCNTFSFCSRASPQ
jgi:ribosomal protein S27AE